MQEQVRFTLDIPTVPGTYQARLGRLDIAVRVEDGEYLRVTAEVCDSATGKSVYLSVQPGAHLAGSGAAQWAA